MKPDLRGVIRLCLALALLLSAGVPAGAASMGAGSGFLHPDPAFRVQTRTPGLHGHPSRLRTVALPASEAQGADQGAAVPPSSRLPNQQQLEHLIGHSGLLWTALTFLGLGLLLAFTPCVLPMIPILTGIIAGQGEKNSALRGFLLSGVYVLAMALAYTIFGVLAGLAGGNLQASLQTPPVIALFSALFVLLALAMFGFYELRLPATLRDRLTRLSERQRGGRLLGSAAMGFIAALIVGPCVTPALAGALLYIGQSGNAALGALALFSLGIGMGLPLILLGTLGGHWLPRAGAWMNQVQRWFGVVFLGVAIWMLARIIPEAVTLALWAILFLVSGVYLGALESLGSKAGGWQRLAKGSGIVALVYGAMLAVGAASGGNGPLHPLSGFKQPVAVRSGNQVTTAELHYRTVNDMQELKHALATASAQRKPAMLEFDADWCISCKRMKHQVLSKAPVRRLLSGMVLLRVDLTEMNQAKRSLMSNLRVIGPPTFLFYNRKGQEILNARLVGETGEQAFIRRLQRTLENVQT